MTGPRFLAEGELQLTERAAAAAGYEVRRFRARDLVVIHVRETGGPWRYFAPLDCDAEAFALQVRMCMSVDVGTDRHATAKTPIAPQMREPLPAGHWSEGAAAARLAIVKAVALVKGE